MNPQEELTWLGIQQKDEESFARYYREHYAAFFLMACGYVRDARLAQEIVNDVFIKLWKDGARLRIDSSLKAYIYRAVINRSLNALDKHKRDRNNRKEWSRHREPGFQSRQIEVNELEIRLYKAIDQLPEQCRKVFKMSRFGEMKQQEIADRLGISIKTVKNHITYALRRLNSALGDTVTSYIFLAMTGTSLLLNILIH